MSETGSGGDISLKRVLTLRDLVIYGIILIQPVAPMALFGVTNRDSQGHAVLAILLAMTAIIFTAFSYGRMANHYPAAGSAYTYVGRGLNPHLGFIAGFTMFLDYLIVPVICTVYCGIAANHMVPLIPTWAWFVIFSVLFTWTNLRGIKATARVNMILMIVMCMVVLWFLSAAVDYIVGQRGVGGLFTVEPFYHSDTFSLKVIGSGTALAALTYIGFDGLTTLSEEVENPRRNVLLATVITCLVTGLLSGLQIYMAQAAVPWSRWPEFLSQMAAQFGEENAIEKAMIGVGSLVGGRLLEMTLAFILLVAHVGSGVTGITGSSRILYGMGRDGILPERIFGRLSKRFAVPSWNILAIGGLTLIFANLLSYDQCAHLINFGAFLAFMLVNAAVVREYYFRGGQRGAVSLLKNVVAPVLGVLACFGIWYSLPAQTFIVGGSWLAVGVIYLAVRTRGFRRKVEVKDIF